MRKRIIAVSRSLVGKKLSSAEKIAVDNGSTLRIVEQDGIPIEIDASLDNNRVNVSVVDGKVTRILFLG